MARAKELFVTTSRRAVLAGTGALSLAMLLPQPVRAGADDNRQVFRHGVASGDPDATSVVIWTRATADGPLSVHWEVASDPQFTRIIRAGTFDTGPDRDFTVKVVVEGLPASGIHYYRFRALAETSPVGRARTLPRGRLDRLGIALASCSNYAFGFFNAYDAIARDPEVDYVLHTGDYIYEYGADEWGSGVAHRIGRVHEPAHEIISLADYRQRHAQYKTDGGAQAMHAAHTLLACWDDHESANNLWVGGAQNHQPDREGDWEARRMAAVRAYYEWMPVREPVAGRNRFQFWRSYNFGDLATLFTLETRHTARAEQVDYRQYEGAIQSLDDAREMERATIDAPDRRMVSQELEADLEAAMVASVKGRQPWRVIGTASTIARTRVPDVVALGLLPDPASTSGASYDARVLAWKGKWNLPFYTDTWDGYEWARERLYSLSRRAGAGDLIFLAGDSHSFWANCLADAEGRPAGVEFGTAGITSPGDFVDSGFGPELSEKLDRAFEAHNPEVIWTDNLHQGYVRLAMTHGRADAAFVAVNTVVSRDYQAATLKRFSVMRGGLGLTLKEQPA